MPFILRGVSLVGIESVFWPSEDRPRLWARMAEDFSGRNLLDLVEGPHRPRRSPAKPHPGSSPEASVDASWSTRPDYTNLGATLEE